MTGTLKFLVSDDPRAIALRDTFVFKLVPIINPDGVARGHFRADLYGVNLNRVYLDPSLERAPTVYGIKALVTHFQERIFFFLDMHAHSNKKGAFFYGNCMDFHKQIDIYLMAKLVQLNCVNFDLAACNFTEENMYQKDKNGDSRDGSSRVAFHIVNGIARCYTLESTYNMGSVINPVPRSGLPEDSVTNPESEIYEEGPPLFDIEILHDIGRAVCIAVLDCADKNEWSRIK
jgi:hypothetical protein